MVEITVRYQGQLRCAATHGPSQSAILTDAPVDNHGKGEAFSPTDLVAAALPSCIMTILGIYGERHGIDLAGMHARTVKEMSKTPPRRIASLRTTVSIPIFLYHGDRDVTVPISESERFVSILKSTGKPYRYLAIKDMGHQYNRWEVGQAAEVLTAIDSYLTTECGPGGL